MATAESNIAQINFPYPKIVSYEAVMVRINVFYFILFPLWPLPVGKTDISSNQNCLSDGSKLCTFYSISL